MSSVPIPPQPVPNSEKHSGHDPSPVPDTFIGRTIRIATGIQRQLLLYLGSAAAAVAGLSYLGFKGDMLEAHERIVAWMVTALPLLATFFGITLPEWFKQRRAARLARWSLQGRKSEPGYFRIGPYENSPEDQSCFVRADGAHESVHQWLVGTSQPLLFLTGASGAGKSSLLNAYVIPRLCDADPRACVLVLRSFDNPLVSLRTELMSEGVVWKKPPRSENGEPIVQLVRRACLYLQETRRRLILVFDQFEELLLAHQREAGAVAEVREFLVAVVHSPVPGLAVLLTMRSDYEGMLMRLSLPPLEYGRNWMKVDPFSERDARAFLSKGFEHIGNELLDAIMDEAAAIEDTRGLVRPITLNMLGAVLARSADNKELRATRGRLLTADLQRILDSAILRDHARAVLAPMLTDVVGAKQPRSVSQLQDETGVSAEVVEGCLLHLASHGLVRRLTRVPALPQRVWEISHDFVARLVRDVLQRPPQNPWRYIRLGTIAVAFLLWFTFFGYVSLDYFSRSEQRIIGRLSSETGISIRWDSELDGYRAIPAARDLEDVAHAGELMRHLGNVKEIDLSSCGLLTSLSGLEGLTDLQNLKAASCTRLTNLDGLKGLANLKKLDLSGCENLTNMDGLQGDASLEMLDLSGCKGLKSVEGLQGLDHLKTLNLGNCTGLQDLGGLQGLTGLESLSLWRCEGLTNLNGLRGLTSLKLLNLVGCDRVRSLRGLHGLTSLKELWFAMSKELASLDGLQEAPNLETLHFAFCTKLASVKELRGLSKLQTLDLHYCKELTSLDGLQGLTSLTTLDLRDCTALKSLEELRGLKSIEYLDLRDLTVTDFKPICSLTGLRRLGITVKSVPKDELELLNRSLPNVVLVTGLNEQLLPKEDK